MTVSESKVWNFLFKILFTIDRYSGTRDRDSGKHEHTHKFASLYLRGGNIFPDKLFSVSQKYGNWLNFGFFGVTKKNSLPSHLTVA